jgi:signal transduction histidine kinase
MNDPRIPAADDVEAAETRPTILVIDDSPEYLRLLGELFSPLYSVRVALSGRRALEIAAAHTPDLVLLDVMMPEMDGYAVLAELRRDPHTREVPVIFVTGLEAAADEHRGFALGAADYVVKPYNADIVLARVRLHLELKQARDRLREQNAALEAEIEHRTRVERVVRSLNARLRTRTDALERSVGDLGAFSYSVSHDLRAPLRTISGFAELLVETETAQLSEEGRGMLERIISGVRRMERMIADVLAYSRVERTEVRLAPVYLRAVAQEVVRELAPAYPDTEVVVGALPTVVADAAMVRQIFANLIGNALKFSALVARPRIEINTDGDSLAPTIEVRDNGVGFESRHAARLFGLFQRLHSEAAFPGTGVGLAIVKRLVERHGGTIIAKSDPGVLTTFSFTLRPELEQESSATEVSAT